MIRQLGVAPMEGVTTFPTRLWLHWTSAPAFMTTPFLRVTEVFPGSELPDSFAPELGPLKGLLSYELTPQLLAASPDHFLRAAKLLPAAFAPMIEINYGCPSPNSAGKTAGSCALRDAAWFGETVARLSDTLGPQRLGVKMRLGFDSPDEFDALLEGARRPALGRLTVHGRTRADGYRGQARWDLIGKAARQTACATWGSGDVVGRSSYDAWAAAAPEATGILIGRGVLRNPWVFDEVRNGVPVTLGGDTLADALLSFTLAHELWQRDANRFVTKVASARWDDWERRVTTLSTLAFGVPCVARGLPRSAAVSNVALSRLKMLWGYLGPSLPAVLQDPKAARAKSLAEFFEHLSARITAAGTVPFRIAAE